MDPRDVPNHSPAHTHSFYDSNPSHPNTVLRSPPLPHDPPYGMHGVPSAFSVMGRRPGLPDFRGSLAHDPILGSQSALTSPGSLHGSLSSPAGGAGWWMHPHHHPRALGSDFFTSHLTSSWLSHEHDRAHGNHDRIEECLYPTARTRSNLMNGSVSSANVFGTGSGIFYPPPASSQSLPNFVHQPSATTASKCGLSHWGSHGNHEGRSALEPSESHDLEMVPCFERRLSSCSETSNDKDGELRPAELTSHHKDTGKDARSEDFEAIKTSNISSESLDLRSTKLFQQDKNLEISDTKIQRQPERAVYNETQQTLKSAKKNKTKTPARMDQDNMVLVSAHESNSDSNKTLSTPPKLHKVKPPKLQVPSSILNTKEGIIPLKQDTLTKTTISSLLKEEILKTGATSVLHSDRSNHTGTAPSIVLSQTEGKTKNTADQGVTSASKVLSLSQKPSSKSTTNQPKIPSGKPPLLTQFHAIKYNEDTSDDDSDSSNVSSDTESGSASDEESEEGEEGENGEDSSGSDSESEGSDEEEEGGEQQDDDYDEDDEDELFAGTQGSGTSFEEMSPPSKRKVEDGSETPRKRRRAVNEDAVRIPLANGWRRQTRLRQVGAAGGLRGDVYYFAPCGKKLRTYPEVTRYLSKNGIANLTSDNFSFSTKLHIGEFLECKQGSIFEPLSEEEVNRRKQAEEEKTRAKLEKINSKKEKKKQQAEMAQKAVEAKLLRKAQRQAALEAAKMAKREREMAKKAAEEKQQRKAQKRAAMEAVKMAKRERAEAKMRSKAMKREALQVAREAKKERVRMLAEQKRLAKERAKEQRQMARRKKKEDAANAKYEDAMKKAKERELKRQQAVLLKQQEKEQKRQQQMMIRAIESQRKAEERERLKEEKRMEKKLLREKKLEQKRREMILARELKKPVEDMVLKDSKMLPELPRAQGVQIPGGAFADLLMLKEFVHNFGEALDLDSSEIPSLWEMQSSLLNDSSEDVLVPLCQSLLISALEDPGCEGPDSFTMLGVPLAKVELNDANFSEVLRLFIISRNAGDPHVLSDAVKDTPFQALSVSLKAGVMAYLCNELLCSRTVCKEIENSIEHMSNLRRDKWVVEGKIRKLKAIQAEKYPVVKVKKPPGRPRAEAVSTGDPEADNSNSVADDSIQGNDEDEEEEEEEEEDEEEDDDEDDDGEGGGDGTQSSDESEEEEDNAEPTTQEGLERRLRKFEKKHAQFRSKLFSSSHALRALSLGQDRYKRRYWILPYGGGVFAEGMETAEKEIVLDLKPECEQTDQPEAQKDNMEGDGVKQDGTIETMMEGGRGFKQCDGLENQAGRVPGIKSPLKSPNSSGLMSPIRSPVDSKGCLTTCSPNTSGGTVERQGGASNSGASQVMTPQQQSSLGKVNVFSPNAASWSDFHRIESLFRCEASTSNTEHLQHSLVHQRLETRKAWFSLIPRMPCDEGSLTLSHSYTRETFVPTYSKKGEVDLMGTPPPVKRPPGRPPRISNPKYESMELQTSLGSLAGDPAKQATANQFIPQSVIKRPPGRPPKCSYENLNATSLDGQPCPVRQPIIKRPPGRPPKSSYESLNLACLDGQSGSHSMGSLLTSTAGRSTHSLPTTSLSFEELKKNVLESLMQEPAPIPPELQHGWWRITEPSQLKELVKILHSRGIREKILQKNFQKYMEYASSSCSKGDQELDDDSDDEKTDKSSALQSGDSNPIEDKEFAEVAFAINKAILKEVEEMEEKVFAASLQVKGWRLPPKASKGLTHNPRAEFKFSPDGNPLAIAINRLEALELAIERRYLKHPLRNDKVHIPLKIGTAAAAGEVPTEEAQSNMEKIDTDDELVTPALRIWRNAVLTSESASQLSMCLSLLYDCIAWEKSIMKVFCQMCRKGDNEQLLLLCDGCDRGYHTYCCMPKLSSIPEGDWYCTDCIVLAAGGDNCCMCGGASGKMAKCDNCPRNFHLQCLEPPLSKVPRASWTCPTCKRKRIKPRSKRKIKQIEEEEDDDRPLTPPPRDEVRPHANRKQSSKDMAPCRMILAEMEKHDDAWPFLVPVNPKQFPEYYQIIKKPMDFHTMKIKLRDCQYGTRSEFVEDARTVFLNCEEFNEDDSEVGQAGKRLLKFFERRWEELSPTVD